VGAALAAPVMVLSGVLVAMQGEPAPSATAPGRVAVPQASTPASARPAVHDGGAGTLRAGRPRVVVVPTLGVRAAVSPIRLDGHALTPPADPTRVGWWTGGARPGARTGTAVLTGHTVHTGGGAFDRLDDLVPGDDVAVRTAGGAVTYVVRSVQVLSRDDVARRSAGIFRQTGAPRLVLVTCEDWDGTAYRSNVVVTAAPVG